eukprot:ctg_728.g359
MGIDLSRPLRPLPGAPRVATPAAGLSAPRRRHPHSPPPSGAGTGGRDRFRQDHSGAPVPGGGRLPPRGLHPTATHRRGERGQTRRRGDGRAARCRSRLHHPLRGRLAPETNPPQVRHRRYVAAGGVRRPVAHPVRLHPVG